MIPIIYYTVIGIYKVINYGTNIKNQKIIAGFIVILYLTFFILFIKTYINQDWDNYSTFESDLEEVIQYVDNMQDKEIYITNKIKESYIYVLFYSEYNTRDFVETVQYHNQYVEFRQVEAFGNYHFDTIDNLKLDDENIYVIKKQDKGKYNLEEKDCKITEFNKYIVIESRKEE